MEWKSARLSEITALAPEVLSIQITPAMKRENTPRPVIAKGFTNLLTLYQCRWEAFLPVFLPGLEISFRHPIVLVARDTIRADAAEFEGAWRRVGKAAVAVFVLPRISGDLGGDG